jgi:hypothetical protein
MGARYKVNRVSTALSTTADLVTIVAPANRSLRIWEFTIGGMGTTSAANEVVLNRSSGGATPSALITPQPLHPDYAAATFTAPTAWATQPTQGVTLDRLPVNANGGGLRKVFPPGSEIEIPAGGQLSIRSAIGTSPVTLDLVVEQV